MQQSKKLLEENANKVDGYITGQYPGSETTEEAKSAIDVTSVIKIRPITMFNEWVAILQEFREVKQNLVVKGDDLSRPEGIVVGVNPIGMPDGAGGVIKPTVQIGDRVAFQPKAILQAFKPADDSDSPYKGKTVVIVSERNLIFKLAEQLPYEIIK